MTIVIDLQPAAGYGVTELVRRLAWEARMFDPDADVTVKAPA